MKLNTHPESTVACNIYKILPCHNNILHAVLGEVKKKKRGGFKSSTQEDAIFHSTIISHSQIGRKLENILNKLLKKCTVHVLHQIHVTCTSHH